MAILVYGSLVPDIVFHVPRLPGAGEDVPASEVSIVAAGGGGNVAMALAGWGRDVTACGNTVGADPLGRWTAEQFTAAGVRLPDAYISESGSTPPNGIIVTPDGERTIVGNEYRQVQWLPVETWDGLEVAVVDSYSGVAGGQVIETAARGGVPVVASDRTDHLNALTVIIWSASEHPDPAEAQAAADTGPLVAVTAGPHPISVYSSRAARTQIAVQSIDAPDSTGAGDVLTAAVAAGLTDGLTPVEAVSQAADAATRYVAGR